MSYWPLRSFAGMHFLILFLAILLVPISVRAESSDPSHSTAKDASKSGPLAPLEKALDQNHQQPKKKKASAKKKKSMGGMEMGQGQMGGMGKGMEMGMGMQGSQAQSPMGGMMGMMDDMMSKMGGMGMMGMSPMQGQGMSNQKGASQLPGFPGSPHLYHLGATGFFLDYSQKLGLGEEQLKSLSQIKEQTAQTQTENYKKIETAEKELWNLTASDRPDAENIELKVRQIESLRSERRLNFIRAVGEAAKVLNTEQQTKLLGAPDPSSSHSGASHQKQPDKSMSQGGQMSGMMEHEEEPMPGGGTMGSGTMEPPGDM